MGVYRWVGELAGTLGTHTSSCVHDAMVTGVSNVILSLPLIRVARYQKYWNLW